MLASSSGQNAGEDEKLTALDMLCLLSHLFSQQTGKIGALRPRLLYLSIYRSGVAYPIDRKPYAAIQPIEDRQFA